jgi:hypothetical protein
METVRRYKEAQLALIQARGHPIILGDFVFANFMGKNYILDGQHRMAMLGQLRDEGVNFANTKVSVQIIDCVTLSDINSLYVMANERYTVNGNISSQGTVYTTSTSAQAVVEQLKLRFNNFNTQGKERRGKLNAPYFDVNDLTSQLNASGLLNTNTVDQLVQLIVTNNEVATQRLSPAQVKKCTDGFYLAYGHPECKWVRSLAKI